MLLSVAGTMSLGGPIADLIFRQYFVNSDAVRDAGLYGAFPTWWIPSMNSPAMTERMLFHGDWLIPILLIAFMLVIGKLKSYTLGYFFFRLTSDVEKLPFPFAPVAASGSMALSESGEKKTSWKWNVFSIGAIIGMVFAVVQVGIPLVTGALLTKPIQIIPLPWLDTTTMSEGLMPATPTGVTIDLGLLITGMVVPFWSVMGTAAAVLLTFILNPILHHFDILNRWQPGMDVINTTYVNGLDFWTSFGIGTAIALVFISLYQCGRDLAKQVKAMREQQKAGASATARRENLWAAPAGRGDYPIMYAVGIYVVAASAVVILSQRLAPEFPLWILIGFVFIYTPLISYINARLIGINGQQVVIPYLREGAFILSGVKGINIWLAPIPVDNYGAMAQIYRTKELTGTNFWSYVKADALIVPLSFVLSFVFWAFIWHSSAIPSDAFPWAQKMWELQAKNTMVMWSITLPAQGGTPLFYQAMHPWTIAGAGVFTVGAFSLLSAFNLPTMAIYGFIYGIGQIPHSLIFLVAGAFIGKFYFQKRFGQTQFLQMAPVLMAGYTTGMGLIALVGVAVMLITKAISAAPF
ncbi:MAG: hypothetical protein BWY76_00472 [bacterium ADurb.Bin429]|nr:MAG: hypothetical protein BWY76_00472 [bacterium ADurb.Bin429]